MLGGVLGGMKTGGENIFTGVAAGITGLVTKPIEEGMYVRLYNHTYQTVK